MFVLVGCFNGNESVLITHLDKVEFDSEAPFGFGSFDTACYYRRLVENQVNSTVGQSLHFTCNVVEVEIVNIKALWWYELKCNYQTIDIYEAWPLDIDELNKQEYERVGASTESFEGSSEDWLPTVEDDMAYPEEEFNNSIEALLRAIREGAEAGLDLNEEDDEDLSEHCNNLYDFSTPLTSEENDIARRLLNW
jgi:hypothetical protein